jgi:hypothetical protein
LRVRKGDSLKTMYAKAHRALSAADLQKFTEIDEGIPGRQLVAELEALDKEAAAAKRKSGDARKR